MGPGSWQPPPAARGFRGLADWGWEWHQLCHIRIQRLGETLGDHGFLGAPAQALG